MLDAIGPRLPNLLTVFFGMVTDVSYYRRPVTWSGSHPRLGKPQLWSIGIDGSNNSRA